MPKLRVLIYAINLKLKNNYLALAASICLDYYIKKVPGSWVWLSNVRKVRKNHNPRPLKIFKIPDPGKSSSAACLFA
jgi:hypothetical protein